MDKKEKLSSVRRGIRSAKGREVCRARMQLSVGRSAP